MSSKSSIFIVVRDYGREVFRNRELSVSPALLDAPLTPPNSCITLIEYDHLSAFIIAGVCPKVSPHFLVRENTGATRLCAIHLFFSHSCDPVLSSMSLGGATVSGLETPVSLLQHCTFTVSSHSPRKPLTFTFLGHE